jgi:hypothetical protein
MTIAEDRTLPLPAGRGRVSTVAQLADIPEEEIWLQKQESARTRRAYRLDVQRFMATLDIGTADELRQADHKAVIAWERYMREVEHAAASTSPGMGGVGATNNVAPGALAGNFAGATASAAAGANVLVGGSNNTISLQPLSIEGNTGLNVAAGIGAVTLRFAGRG